ncbi:MAG: hypothetical protein KGM24_08010 [Elusimicrobia bacterium]|nr:hypothetical protein [Elusimicrobiota bacterium]
MRRAAPLLAVALALSACVAVTVSRRPPRKGPVAAVGYVEYGGGEIRYSAEGWGPVVASRRRTALALMRRNCGELKPDIEKEFERTDADAVYEGEDVESLAKGVSHYVLERYVHLVYCCVPPGGLPKPAPAAVAASTGTVVISTTTLPLPAVPAKEPAK